MKITEITVSRGQTRQFTQYEPTTFHVSVKAEILENGNPDASFAELSKIASDEIRKQIREKELELEAKAQMMKK